MYKIKLYKISLTKIQESNSCKKFYFIQSNWMKENPNILADYFAIKMDLHMQSSINFWPCIKSEYVSTSVSHKICGWWLKMRIDAVLWMWRKRHKSKNMTCNIYCVQIQVKSLMLSQRLAFILSQSFVCIVDLKGSFSFDLDTSVLVF